jgi:hypothetical protein
MFTHIFVAPLGCIDIGGALLNFLENCAKWHLYVKFEFHSIYTHLGGAKSICIDSKCLLKSFVSFNQGSSAITKKGEIESASRPLVDFGVSNNNLIKRLISCVKCTSRFLMKVQMYSLIHHLKYNHELNGTM